jgi:ribosomal protein S18 acetylase RimI-like enzyme
MERKIMSDTSMRIIPMRSSHITGVSKLHHTCISDTVPSLLGTAFLESLYGCLLKDRNALSAVSVTSEGKVIGVVTATADLNNTLKLQKQLVKQIPVVWRLFVLFATGRMKISDVVGRMQFESFMSRFSPQPYSTILTMFVEPSYRKKGIGQLLISYVKKNMTGVSGNLHVDTLSDNVIALSFYKKCGFSEVTEFKGNTVMVNREKKTG